MARASNEAILERINALHEKFDTFYANDYKPLKEDVKLNTEFRAQAKVVWGALCVIASFIGAFFFWIGNKIISYFAGGD